MRLRACRFPSFLLTLALAASWALAPVAEARPQKPPPKAARPAAPAAAPRGDHKPASAAPPRSAPRAAPERHVVFGINGTLIQGVPAGKLAQYAGKPLVQVNGKTYRIADGAGDVLRRLAAEPGTKLSFFSEFSKADTLEILKAISAQKPGAPELSTLATRVLAAEDLTPYQDDGTGDDEFVPKAAQKDLTKIEPDLRKVVLIDDNSRAPIPGQRSQLYYFGPPSYQFESFAQAEQEREALKAQNAELYEQRQKFFPRTEQDWRRHQQRLAGIYGVLQAATEKLNSKQAFASAVNEEAKGSFDAHIEAGLAELNARLAWKVSDGRAVGCKETIAATSSRPARSRTLSPEHCAAALPVSLKWAGLKGDGKKNLCARVTEQGDIVAEEAAQSCLDAIGGHLIWLDPQRTRCGIFTEEFVFVAPTEARRCSRELTVCADRNGVLTQIAEDSLGKILATLVPDTIEEKKRALDGGCRQPPGPATANDSPRKKYFEELLRRGTSAPLSDFLQTWYPDRKPSAEAEEKPYFFACQLIPWDTVWFDLNRSELSNRCKPDVTYSWGPPAKLEAIKAAFPDGGTWAGTANPGRGTLFTTLTPASTYMYGPVQIRVKYKPSVRFTSSMGPGRVFVRTNYLVEYNFDDFDVVESWSYGTPEQYDETVRDILRIQSGKRAQIYATEPPGMDLRKFHYSWDGNVAGEDVLKANLLGMIRMILKGEGRIHYSKDACRNRAKFFATDKPTYFNGRTQP